MAMPGIKILSLIAQGPKGCTYKVEKDDSLMGGPKSDLSKSDKEKNNIGFMMYDAETGQGQVLFACDEDGKLPLGLSENENAEIYERYDKLAKLAQKRKWKAVAAAQDEIMDIVAKLEHLSSTQEDTQQKKQILSKASDAMNFLAVSLQSQKMHQQSVVAGRHSLRLAESADDEEARGFALSGLGDALDDSGKYLEAIQVYTRCVAISQKQGNMDETITRLHKIAVTHENHGKLGAAKDTYEEILGVMGSAGMGTFEMQQFQVVIDARLRSVAQEKEEKEEKENTASKQ